MTALDHPHALTDQDGAVPSEWAFENQPGVQLATDHFVVYTTIGPDPFRDFLPRYLEAVYLHFTAVVPPPTTADQPPDRMQTYLLATRAQWERFIRDRFPERHDLYRRISSGGFTERNVSVVYRLGPAATLSLLAHETMHQYLSTHFTDPLPAWLNEGLAAYCESVDVRHDRVHFLPDRNTFRMNDLRDALIADRTLPLRRLLATDAGELLTAGDSSQVRTYYAQTWALIAFIRDHQQRRYRPGFDRLLRALRDGTMRITAQAARVTAPRPADTSYGEAAFRAFITNDLDAFESQFDEYLHRMAWAQ
ncbi:MAG: DUF1570 domain-containing protein [Phycisphaerales bacterium]|nr:DUF1570 domain-containing protein [Phycisphaerales bacterium]